MPAERFRTSGTLDENLLRSLGDDLLPRGFKAYMLAVRIIGFAGAIGACIGRSYAAAALLAVLGCASIIGMRRTRRRTLDINLKRMEETNGTASATYEVTLSDDGILLSNAATGGKAEFPYESVKRVHETPRAYMLVTEARQIVPVFKAGDARDNEMLGYLQEKLPAARWKISKPRA